MYFNCRGCTTILRCNCVTRDGGAILGVYSLLSVVVKLLRLDLFSLLLRRDLTSSWSGSSDWEKVECFHRGKKYRRRLRKSPAEVIAFLRWLESHATRCFNKECWRLKEDRLEAEGYAKVEFKSFLHDHLLTFGDCARQYFPCPQTLIKERVCTIICFSVNNKTS